MQQTYFIFLLLDVLSENLKLFFCTMSYMEECYGPTPKRVQSIVNYLALNK